MIRRVLFALLRVVLAPLARVELAIRFWRDRGLSHTWCSAWRSAARHI